MNGKPASDALSHRKLLCTMAAAGFAATMPRHVSACSRVFWNDNPVKVVGRTLDWTAPFDEVLWAMPAGLECSGDIADNPARWTSKHGSVVMAAFDKGAAEGVNDRGLAAHLLYLSNTKYEERDAKRPGVAFWLWVQYILDNYGSVREAIGAPNPPQCAIRRIHGRRAGAPCALRHQRGFGDPRIRRRAARGAYGPALSGDDQ